MVLQALEGLSDRDGCEALRTDIGWKVAAGLTLDDEGFHPTVLTYWRRRVGASDALKAPQAPGCCARWATVRSMPSASVTRGVQPRSRRALSMR